MARPIETIRRRVEAQGFCGLSDQQVREFDGWLRFSPALCLLWVAVGVITASPTVLILLVPFALTGAIWDRHPFDLIYDKVLRKVFGGSPIPSYGRPRRFACLMASVMISITALLFYLEFKIGASVLGGVMITMATVNVMTGFCVPSFIYAFIFGQPAQTKVVAEP